MAEYKYEGKTFYSLKSLADYAGVHEKTLGKRLQRGFSIEKACSKNKFNCKPVSKEIGNKEIKYESITDMCKKNNVSETLVRNRLKYGFSIEEAINKEKKITKQGKSIVYKGKHFSSVMDLVRFVGREKDYNKIARRIREGWTIEDATETL